MLLAQTPMYQLNQVLDHLYLRDPDTVWEDVHSMCRVSVSVSQPVFTRETIESVAGLKMGDLMTKCYATVNNRRNSAVRL